jgi:DNA-binding transcriptional LysR family regulator
MVTIKLHSASTLRIRATPIIAHRLIAPALPRFLMQHPGIGVQLMIGEQTREQSSATCDAVICLEPAEKEIESTARRLALVNEVLCASPEFVAVHGEPGSPEDLDPAFCIGVLGEQSVASEWQFRKGAMETTVTPAARLVCGDLQIAAAVAVRSGGFVRLPALAVESQIAAGLLMSLLPDWSGSRQYVCVRYVSPVTRQLEALGDFIAGLFPTLLRPVR